MFEGEQMIIVLMGVAGSGKTTVGRLLSEELGWKFYDADDFHPPENVLKIKNGIALNDEDRRPWLETLSKLIRKCLERDENAVLACSALKERYRDYLLVDERVRLVYLKGSYELFEGRLNARHGHYMDARLLRSQFETLEEPVDGLHVDASSEPGVIVRMIKGWLGSLGEEVSS